MKILNCYAHGIGQATRHPKMTALVWLFNFVMALPILFLFRAAFGGAIGDSLAAADLLKKADMNVIFEFMTSSGIVLGELFTAALLLLVFHVCVSIFVFGGILNVLDPGQSGIRFSQSFFSGGGRFYGRFFRLTLYSLLLVIPAAIVFLIANSIISLATKNPSREQLAFGLNIFRILLALFLAYAVKMILDYARIRIAVEDTRKVLESLVQSIRFVFGRPLKTFGLYYLLGLTGWVILTAYLAIHSAYACQSTAMVIIGFLISQVFLASRAWLKIAYQAAQKNLLESAG
jgi:hypothetical protein